MGKRIVFTGGSGVAGRWVVQELLRYGHEILNLDIAKLDNPSVQTMKCDITDAGQVYSAMHTQFKLTEPLEVASVPDAVIHFAGYARPLLAPDNEVFQCNVTSVHNVIEAACKMGVKKVILASSITTYGVTFAQGSRDFDSFPIQEDADCNPTDPYALSKLVSETIARSFASRFGVDIYCLRIGAVVEPDQYREDFKKYLTNPDAWAPHAWSYTDVRDLGKMCHRGLMVDGLGWQVFNAVNNEITNLECTEDFLRQRYPSVPITRRIEGSEAPVCNKKLRDMLGFKEEHSWKQYCQP
ncbi:NAD dependent epimerase/dehydratase [Dactylonectria macrodidyma]|uniref:NAD dependent epimerase/dehydratase n=1 Tax=Dactylonectria macrodidyma TaxID=307937 RepID=A0A9P9ELW5_9HYPO|nr:NAD dependent epimerase/dehydratase [Dactylonectria macrodidyma]